jgi:hypothetical protein
LNIAQQEEVEIRRRDGLVFSLTSKKRSEKSPFDVSGIKTKATTADIMSAIDKSRKR